ncbi:hypothetical protein BP6252_01238 [Coleophoma cylindrospora]|uniref:Elongator complex protein 5 n=1 Tax=Coleophoma cylindrospora TaxID=1849047 RepID=A0A3D8SSB5_9HELO|nr:hypothetical protein BP6252_01238 [Coleophoma cylindrospora]
MAPTPLQHRRTHNTLLLQKLLNLRDGASPFTLVLDSLEQGGAAVIREFVGRAKISKSKVVFLSFATLKRPLDVDVFITARGKPLSSLRSEILSHLPDPSPTSPKTLIVIDSLNPLSTKYVQHLSTFLSSLLIAPTISLLATYHLDIPLPTQPDNQYQPDPLTTLTYLSTAILSIKSLSQVIKRKKARDRSLQEPLFGVAERREGILVGLSGSSGLTGKGDLVIEMELRRKSGRGVVETFILSPSATLQFKVGTVSLLDDHSEIKTPAMAESGSGQGQGDDEVESTFSLGLTEKQKRDRDGVVLPYFDAQRDGGLSGPGEGGRILYEMGEEDKEDFDDEEDEI